MWHKKLPRFAGTSELRSRNMAAIRSRNNLSTERRLRSLFIRRGVRGWKLNAPRDIGSPDFWFPRSRVIVFVHGCFWHACPRCGHIPKTNVAYWKAKLSRNQLRDRRVKRSARNLGYFVVQVWECELKTRPISCVDRILRIVNRESKHNASFREA